MDRRTKFIVNLDWMTILLYVLLVLLGWLNIYAAVYDDNYNSILDMTQRYGKQFVWICAGFVIAFLILLTDSKFFSAFSFVIYGIIISLLLAVLIFGLEVKASKSWFELGGIRIQPAEFAKFATALVIANVMSKHGFKIMRFRNLLQVGILILLPIAFILLQNDTGSALVYSSFVLVLYREGLYGSVLLLLFAITTLFILTLLYSPLTLYLLIITGSTIAFYYYRRNKHELMIFVSSLIGICILSFFTNWLFDLSWNKNEIVLYSYLLVSLSAIYFIYKQKMKKIIMVLLCSWLCIGATITVDSIFEKLQPHQKNRINNFLGIETDLTGWGYNVHQSKIAIGSGGFLGKGFLEGTQTKFNFVPEQSTDFIFCTVGEEWGFVGSTVVLLLLMTLILRVIFLAERQRSAFSRIYGYCVACIFFFHVAVNVGMTIGLAPVIGIPLPFFSYGGSSLWAFTILLFIFLRLDANRLQIFR